jgi:prepilin-type processing-associated H-X9-DG protein
MKCGNNLKQIGLAMHNYHGVYNCFPAGYLCQPPQANSNYTAPGWGWGALLLPYIEQDNLYKTIDLKKSVDAKENLAVAATLVKTFVNPRDPVLQVSKDFGGTNYLFNAGSQFDLKDNDGVFFEKSKIKFPDITDGTSNTILSGETLKGNGSDKGADVNRQIVALTKDALKDLTDDSGAKEFKDKKNISGDRCKNWMDGRFLEGTFTGTRAINDEKPDVDCGGHGGLSGLRGTGKGVNIGMCDGSVRYVPVTISLDVIKALVGRNDGIVIPNF